MERSTVVGKVPFNLIIGCKFKFNYFKIIATSLRANGSVASFGMRHFALLSERFKAEAEKKMTPTNGSFCGVPLQSIGFTIPIHWLK